MSTEAKPIVDSIGKWITVLATLVGLAWGTWSTLETWARDSRRPFLDKQLALYEEATKMAAILATSSDPAELTTAEGRFEQLYWGEMALVENGGLDAEGGGVEAAMVAFRGALLSDPDDRESLRVLSLRLAHACRDSLAESWGVPGWKSPRYSSEDR